MCELGWNGPDCSVHMSEAPTQTLPKPGASHNGTNATITVPIPYVFPNPMLSPEEEECREVLDTATNSRRYRRGPENSAEGGGD
jgi:hypothetical protein